MVDRTIYEDADVAVIETWSDTDPPELIETYTVDKPGSPGANADTLLTKIDTGIDANISDLNQLANIITQAQAIEATTGTLTVAAISGYVRQLAQGIELLAKQMQSCKRQLNAIGRITANQLDTTDGT